VAFIEEITIELPNMKTLEQMTLDRINCYSFLDEDIVSLSESRSPPLCTFLQEQVEASHLLEEHITFVRNESFLVIVAQIGK